MPNLSRRAFVGAAAASAGLAATTARAKPPVQVIGHVKRIDPALDEIFAGDAQVVQVVQGFTWCEGPCWVPALDALVFSDVPENTAYRWSRTRGLGLYLKPSGWLGAPDPHLREAGSNGWALDPDGKLLEANSGGRSVMRVDPASKAKTTLADRFEGHRFNSPNDLIAASDGTIYFTDPPYGLADGDKSPVKEMPFNGVYRLAKDGTVTAIDRTLTLPNGVGLSPDERTLYVSVSDPARPRVMAYDLDRQGHPSNARVFFDAMPLMGEGVKGLPDGLTVDAHGRLFCAGPGGLMILSAAGKLLGQVQVEGRPVSNCVFGENGKTLFMTCGDLIASVRTRMRGT